MTEQLNRPAAPAPSTKPSTATVAPEAASPPVDDLEARISARKLELIAKLVELRQDTQDGAAEARDKIKARLSELAHIVRAGVVDGWVNIGDAARTKLDQWLAR